jgi:hypothetical protein
MRHLSVPLSCLYYKVESTKLGYPMMTNAIKERGGLGTLDLARVSKYLCLLSKWLFKLNH